MRIIVLLFILVLSVFHLEDAYSAPLVQDNILTFSGKRMEVQLGTLDQSDVVDFRSGNVEVSTQATSSYLDTSVCITNDKTRLVTCKIITVTDGKFHEQTITSEY